jgi:hypothetical protein
VKKWWNRGTRFPESKLACRKLLRPRREGEGQVIICYDVYGAHMTVVMFAMLGQADRQLGVCLEVGLVPFRRVLDIR